MLWNLLFKTYHTAVLESLTFELNPAEGRELEIKKELAITVRQLMGKRITSVSSGSAALSPLVRTWMNEIFCDLLVNDSYGTTETGGIAHDQRICPDLEVKLRDVAEMGYLTSDKPFPRGEVLVKCPGLAIGYFKRPEETKLSFLPDGWYATGDLGSIDNEGKLIITGRVSTRFKVSSGEYLSPEKVESVLVKCKYVQQIIVLGDASLDFIIAVVVPNMEFCKRIEIDAKNEEKSTTMSSSSSSSSSSSNSSSSSSSSSIQAYHFQESKYDSSLILTDIRQLAEQGGLLDFETPRYIHIEGQPFTVENQGLTLILKYNRTYLKKKYDYLLDRFRQTGKTVA